MLEQQFIVNAYPDAKQREIIAKTLGVDSEAVDNWFVPPFDSWNVNVGLTSIRHVGSIINDAVAAAPVSRYKY